MLDTSRQLTIDGRLYGSSFAVDFANDSKELVIIGSNFGSIWSLESFSAIIDSVDALRSYGVFTGSQRFASNLNGDVIVRITRTAIGVFSRASNSIVHVLDLAPNRINSVQMGVDNTILCITDSGEVSILNNVLETMCKDTLGRNVSGVVSVAWNSQKSTIVAHTNENELVYLRYSPLTSVDVTLTKSSSIEAVLIRTFDITLTNATSDWVRVYSSLGLDVTEACKLSQSGDDVHIVSHELAPDVYAVVDVSTALVKRQVLYLP